MHPGSGGRKRPALGRSRRSTRASFPLTAFAVVAGFGSWSAPGPVPRSSRRRS